MKINKFPGDLTKTLTKIYSLFCMIGWKNKLEDMMDVVVIHDSKMFHA